MLVYPQLATGAISHFPVRKRIQLRTVVNRGADGSYIKASDPAAATTAWELNYSELTDGEAATLQQFFIDAEGQLNDFTFLDPVGNLLASSDLFNAAVWEKDPLLDVASGLDDPRGSKLAWRLKNTSGGPQSLAQTLAAPDGYIYCLSAYAMASQASTATLIAGGQRKTQAISTQWSRLAFTAQPDTPRFGIEIPAGSEVDIFGMQVEPQPSPSDYRSTTRGGVYEGARLKDDSLKVKATGYNRNSCTVNIIHANHL
jgi:hypothetical protein